MLPTFAGGTVCGSLEIKFLAKSKRGDDQTSPVGPAGGVSAAERRIQKFKERLASVKSELRDDIGDLRKGQKAQTASIAKAGRRTDHLADKLKELEDKYRSLFKGLRLSEGMVRDTYDRLRFSIATNQRTSLLKQYGHLHAGDGEVPDFNKHEVSLFSQNGEDGLVLHVLDIIGAEAKTFVEIGGGNASENNSTNLAVNFGWSGLIVEADPGFAATADALLERLLGGDGRVKVVEAYASSENAQQLARDNGLEPPVDFLSVDIDSVDLWVWQSLVPHLKPRLCVCEYNHALGDAPISVPDEAGFVRKHNSPDRFHYGASLTAFERMGRQLGYTLVGRDSTGTNAFFVRNDLMQPLLAARPASELLQEPVSRMRSVLDDEGRRVLLSDFPWAQIGEDGSVGSWPGDGPV